MTNRATINVNFVPDQVRDFVDPRLAMPTPELLRSVISGKSAALLEYIQGNNWICPCHDPWLAMWQDLPDSADGTKVGGPMPGNAWGIWPDVQKHECFIRHLLYADKQGVINQVDVFLRNLESRQWVNKPSK